MNNNSFIQKQIRVDITLDAGTFDGQHNAKSYEGFKTDVQINKPGLPDQNKAKVQIYNISPDDMRHMTTLSFKPLELKRNLISVYAGDVQNGMSMCFSGEIITAHADFTGAPSVKMVIEAASGAFPSLKAAAPVAVNGAESAARLIGQFAAEIGYTFENRNVTASVKNAVFNGSPIEKARAVANQIGAELLIDDNKMILMQYTETRSGNAVLLAPDTGMLGYPTFTNDGVAVKALYNPELELGGLVKIQSVVPGTEGEWKITKLTHTLQANATSPGPWFSEIEAAPLWRLP